MNLVLTIAIGDNYQRIAALTNPSIKKYAAKIGAKFMCVRDQRISQSTPHWEKFRIYYLLEKYERILYVDSDLIIREDCPNLFEVVPIGFLGVFNEAPFDKRDGYLITEMCRAYNISLDVWDGRYFNSGVMVISQNHKNLFKKPDLEVSNFFEQSYLNTIFAYTKTPIFELNYRFNRLSILDRFTGEDRHASYIIHYAGFPDYKVLEGVILKDLEVWKRDLGKFEYLKHVYISVTGGLGDQLCAEPAIRWMKENLYPKDEILIGTHFPRIFKHLEKLGVRVFQINEVEFSEDTPYYRVESLPDPKSIQWFVISNLLCHTVDYCSMALMHRTLPMLDRKIYFDIDLEDFQKLEELIPSGLPNLILVHPGMHWRSKTFPVSWWQKIIDGLSEIKGYKVCVIGKYSKGDPPDYKKGERGTVNVKCKEGIIDLRDKLSLGELACLLSISPVLISNDSAPIHLAGAFNNWIYLIPSCKHPDHILPYREGTLFYKTKTFYKKLIIDEVESRPTTIETTSVDVKDINWNKYLVNPQVIIDDVAELCR